MPSQVKSSQVNVIYIAPNHNKSHVMTHIGLNHTLYNIIYKDPTIPTMVSHLPRERERERERERNRQTDREAGTTIIIIIIIEI